MGDYIPLMSQEEIKKRKVWQEKVYQNLKTLDKERVIKILNKELIVLPGMFAPMWGDSLLLAKTVQKEITNTDNVLDLGTGSGIQGIFAAEKAKAVLSVDINPKAIECAKLNIKKYNLDKKIQTRESDLFSNVFEKFDVIIFNPPFRWFTPRDMLERGELDEDYKTLRKFFSEVKKHLNEHGKILLMFSDSGDIEYVKQLINENNFQSKICAQEELNGWKYFVFRLTIK